MDEADGGGGFRACEGACRREHLKADAFLGVGGHEFEAAHGVREQGACFAEDADGLGAGLGFGGGEDLFQQGQVQRPKPAGRPEGFEAVAFKLGVRRIEADGPCLQGFKRWDGRK